MSAGYGRSGFFDFSKDENYEAKYKVGNAALVSAFYESTVDSTSNFRMEIGYASQNLSLEVDDSESKKAFYRNIQYRRQTINLDANYLFRLAGKGIFRLNLLLGLNASYNVTTSALGSGWRLVYYPAVDPNGNPYLSSYEEDWGANSRHSKDLAALALGVNIGVEFSFRLGDRMSLLVQNKYTASLTSVVILRDFTYTPVWAGYVSVGVRRRIGR